MGSGTNWVKRGSLAGTGSAIKINTGFQPVKVELYNEDAPASAVKTDSMAGSNALKRITAGDATYATAVCTMETDGFTIGTDADLNTATETIHWIAYQAHND